MTSHVLLLALFSIFVSTVFAVLSRDDPREQLQLGLKMAAGFIGAAVLLAWLMYPLPF